MFYNWKQNHPNKSNISSCRPNDRTHERSLKSHHLSQKRWRFNSIALPRVEMTDHHGGEGTIGEFELWMGLIMMLFWLILLLFWSWRELLLSYTNEIGLTEEIERSKSKDQRSKITHICLSVHRVLQVLENEQSQLEDESDDAGCNDIKNLIFFICIYFLCSWFISLRIAIKFSQ